MGKYDSSIHDESDDSQRGNSRSKPQKLAPPEDLAQLYCVRTASILLGYEMILEGFDTCPAA